MKTIDLEQVRASRKRLAELATEHPEAFNSERFEAFVSQVKEGEQLDDMLTVSEVAKRLKVNPQTIRRRILDGSLRAIQMGRNSYRISEPDLADWLETLATKPSRAKK